MARAFFVVGHRDWGKSMTLAALARSRRRWIDIGGEQLFIRSMSNDDLPQRYRRFVQRLDPGSKPHVILALCPVFDASEYSAIPPLTALGRRYTMYFLVLRHQYRGSGQITQAEIARLRGYGTVEVLDRPNVGATERAEALRRFIRAHP